MANSVQSTVALGAAYQSTVSVYFEAVEDISATTDDYELVRFGWYVKLSTGSTLTMGRVGGSGATWDRC